MRNGGEIRGVGLDEDAIVRNRADDVVSRPIPESYNSTERHIPAGFESGLREREAAGVAVEDSAYAFPSRFANHCVGVVGGVACVDYYRKIEPFGDLELRSECAALEIARRVVVVVIEAALSDGDGAGLQQVLQRRDVGTRVERGGVMRMDSGGE